MKAVVIAGPQARPQLEERPRPMPGRGEVLIGVRACGVCHGDLMVQAGAFPFARYPIVPGHEIAGIVAAVGEDVDGLRREPGSGSRRWVPPVAGAISAWPRTSSFVPSWNSPG